MQPIKTKCRRIFPNLSIILKDDPDFWDDRISEWFVMIFPFYAPLFRSSMIEKMTRLTDMTRGTSPASEMRKRGMYLLSYPKDAPHERNAPPSEKRVILSYRKESPTIIWKWAKWISNKSKINLNGFSNDGPIFPLKIWNQCGAEHDFMIPARSWLFLPQNNLLRKTPSGRSQCLPEGIFAIYLPKFSPSLFF